MGDKSKMRNLTTQQAQNNATNSAADRSTQLGATGKVQGIASQLMSTGPGQLSPWSSVNYASNLDNIANTYNNIRSQGFKALGQSGFGNSPGAIASVMNTAGRNQGADQTGAYRNALTDTLNQNLTGANMEQGIASQYGGQAQNESNASVSDAAQRINEGSTLGDVMSGLGSVARIAGGFIPGAGAVGGLMSRGGGSQLPMPPSSTVNSSVYGGPSGGLGGVSRYVNTSAGAY